MEKFEYIGIILDDQSKDVLKYKLDGYLKENNITEYKEYLHHVTLVHKSNLNTIRGRFIHNFYSKRIDKKGYGVVTQIGISDKAIAFRVDLHEYHFNNIPHVTAATFNGGKPYDSNKITNWIELSVPVVIEGVIKYE